MTPIPNEPRSALIKQAVIRLRMHDLNTYSSTDIFFCAAKGGFVPSQNSTCIRTQNSTNKQWKKSTKYQHRFKALSAQLALEKMKPPQTSDQNGATSMLQTMIQPHPNPKVRRPNIACLILLVCPLLPRSVQHAIGACKSAFGSSLSSSAAHLSTASRKTGSEP